MSVTNSHARPVRLVAYKGLPPASLGPAFGLIDLASHGRDSGRRLDRLLQVAIALVSLAAIALVALPATHPLARWGFVLGLASQPFWLAATFRARQWGMFAVAFFYCGAWAGGVLARF